MPGSKFGVVEDVFRRRCPPLVEQGRHFDPRFDRPRRKLPIGPLDRERKANAARLVDRPMHAEPQDARCAAGFDQRTKSRLALVEADRFERAAVGAEQQLGRLAAGQFNLLGERAHRDGVATAGRSALD